MKSVRNNEELCSDLVFSALAKMKMRQDALENLFKALHGKVKILANTMEMDNHHKSTPSEDLSKSIESFHDNSNFADLFRLREENFELKREIQRLDHALQMAKDLGLDLNTNSRVYFDANLDALSSGSKQRKKPIISCDSRCTKYVEFESEVAQTRLDGENSASNGRESSSNQEGNGYYGNASSGLHPVSTSHPSHHEEKRANAMLPDRSFTLPHHERQNFSANQKDEASVVRNEAPPMKRTGRSDRITYALGHAQSSSIDPPSSLPKRTREDIRQQLLEDAFLVLQQSGGRYIKGHVQK